MKAIIKTNPTPPTVPPITLFRAEFPLRGCDGLGAGGWLPVVGGLVSVVVCVVVTVDVIAGLPGNTKIGGVEEVPEEGSGTPGVVGGPPGVVGGPPVSSGVVRVVAMVDSWRHEYNRENRSVL